MFDTGLNVPESKETLLLQQQRLIAGKRYVQMFPAGTKELALPHGMSRVENARGVYHFNPAAISARDVLGKSEAGRENEFLELGPYSKTDILDRVLSGDRFVALVERTPDGVEVRTAAGTFSTLADQFRYFEATKSNGNSIACGLPERITEWMKNGG